MACGRGPGLVLIRPPPGDSEAPGGQSQWPRPLPDAQPSGFRSGCRSAWLRVSKAPVSPHVFVPANRDGKAKLEGGSGKSGSPGDRCCGAQAQIRQLLWDPGQRPGPAGVG